MTGAGKFAPALLSLIGLCAGTGSWAQSQNQSSPPAPTEAARPPISSPVHVDQIITKGLLIHRVDPKYPDKARRQHIQGTVVLNAKIDPAGNIADLVLISGDPMLAKAAVKAVRQWKYRPYFVDGKPVEVETEVRVTFALSGY